MAHRTQPQRSRLIAYALAFSFIGTIGLLLIFRAADLPLGQGYFAFRYSRPPSLRLPRVLPVVVIAGLFAAAIYLARRRARIALALLAWIAAATWIWWAPPAPLQQHSFNFMSLSQDGAFFQEAQNIPSLPDYLRRFDRARLSLSIPQLGGTRVLSNPPGTTIVAVAMLRAVPGDPTNWLERMLMRDYGIAPRDVVYAANALRLAALAWALWAASGIVAYFLGRVFMSHAGALLFAMIVTFNPSTLHFTPGKDTAQLLTVNAMLWAWFAGWKSGGPSVRPLRGLLAMFAGALLMLGATMGLIHFWVALAAVAATTWESRKFLWREMAGAVAGALIVIAICWLAVGWNLPATLLAVARKFAQVQGSFNMSRWIWFCIGLPVFLLFLGPGVWAFVAMNLRRARKLGFGMRLAICTAAVMALTYLIGVTYELPRLWVAFLPALTLGLMIDRPLVRAEVGLRPNRYAMRALVVIAVVQIFVSAIHWSILDVRESEYRLITRRLFE